MADISDNGSFLGNLANINSQNFGPTAVANQANTAANTQVQQQSAQAQAMQNKLMAARMPLILSQLHDESVGAGDQSGVGGGGASAGAGGGSSSGGGGQAASVSDKLQAAQDNSGEADPSILNPDKIDAALRAMYFVPQVLPQEMQALRKAYLVDPNDQYGMGPKRVLQQIEMRKMMQMQQSQMGARDDFDALHAVTDAPDGQAMNVLERSHPDTVAAIRQKFKNDPNEERDEEDQARLFAAHAAGAVHQYTGREAVKGDDGVYRDKDTGITIPGIEKVGLSTEQYLKFAHEAVTPSVDVPDGSGGSIKVTPWKAAQMQGAKNMNGPEDWVQMRASQSGLPGAASTLPANSAHKQESNAVVKSSLTKVQQQRAAQPPTDGNAPAGPNGVGTARNAQGQPDQQLTDALKDTKYDYKPTNNGEEYKPGAFKTPPPTVLEDMKNQTAARNTLAKDSNDGVKSAQAALTMYQAAQDILAKGNYDGGKWNAELASKAGKYLPLNFQKALGTAQQTGDYQELTKMLGTAALQAGKGIFAKMTQMEAKMMTKELSPSPEMQPDALRDMITKGQKMAQYSLDSTKRVPIYLKAGKDANQFPSWNQEHFPMETETQPTAAKPDAAGKPPKYTDAQVRAYMQKYNLKDEQATRKALGVP
jgi:hypothetical protein